MKKNIKKSFKALMFCLFIFGFLLPKNLFASNETSEIIISQYISKQILENGHNIFDANKNIIIEIPVNTIKRSAFVEIIKPKYFPSVPLDKNLISNIYHYSILPATENQLSSSITIKIKYQVQSKKWKEIYIYDQDAKKWKKISGSDNEKDGYFSIETKYASGLIAVFEDHLDKSEYLKEKIKSQSILILDAKNGEILVERESGKKRSIASLTKLMTAAVFLDNNPGWNTKVAILPEDDAVPSKIYVKPNDILTTKDLFYATLIKSANNAAKALDRSTGLSTENFIKKMNEKAKDFGMNNTYFEEVTGLSEKNTSTAQDYGILSKKLFSDILFLQATTPKSIIIKTANSNKKITLENSNKIIDVPYIVLGTKTGFTYEAGRCIVMKAKNKQGKEIIAVTMGAYEPGAQWDDMKMLLDATLSK